MDTEPDVPTTAAGRTPQSLSNGLLVTMVVVGPTFLFSELWRGKPIIDQSGDIWLIPAGIMALGFLAGGIVAGRYRRTPDRALSQGVLVAALTMLVNFVVDVFRRLVNDQGIPLRVVGLWVAAAAAALLVGGLGGLYGRRTTLRAKNKTS